VDRREELGWSGEVLQAAAGVGFPVPGAVTVVTDGWTGGDIDLMIVYR